MTVCDGQVSALSNIQKWQGMFIFSWLFEINLLNCKKS